MAKRLPSRDAMKKSVNPSLFTSPAATAVVPGGAWMPTALVTSPKVPSRRLRMSRVFASLAANVASAPPLRPTPLSQDGLLDLFSASQTGADFVLEPATDLDMRGKNAAPKESLEVIYDDA